MHVFPKVVMVAAIMVVGHGVAALAGDALSPSPSLGAVPEARQFSEQNGAAVNVAVNEFNTGQYARAIPALRNVLTLHKLTPYESATVSQLLGNALYEMGDYKTAIEVFENAIGSGGLLPKEASNLRVNIAQLLIASGQPDKGAQMLEDWQTDGGDLSPKHIEYLWQAWSQAEQYDRALPWAEKWFENANPKQRKHYDLLHFRYNNLNMTNAEAQLLQNGRGMAK